MQQQQQQPDDKEFEDFFSDHPKPRANNEHLKEDYRQHFIPIFGGNPKPWSGDEQLKRVYHRQFDQIKNQDLHRLCTRTYIHFLDENVFLQFYYKGEFITENSFERVSKQG